MIFYKLHLGYLQFWNIKPIKQTGIVAACKIIYHISA